MKEVKLICESRMEKWNGGNKKNGMLDSFETTTSSRVSGESKVVLTE